MNYAASAAGRRQARRGHRSPAQGRGALEPFTAHRDVTWQALVGTDNKAYTDEAIGFCVRRWHARPRRRWAICSLPWPMAEREITQKPTWRRRRPLSFAATTRPRANSPRAPKPVSLSHARMGQGRRHRRGKAAVRPEEQLEINQAALRFRETGFHARGFCQCLRSACSSRAARVRPRRHADGRFRAGFSDTQRGDIETIVRNYLIAHPECWKRRWPNSTSARPPPMPRSMKRASRPTPKRSSTRRAASCSATRTATSLRRVLRLQLRLLQARHDRHARSHEDRPQAQGRVKEFPVLSEVRSRPQGRGRRAHAGSIGQEIPRLPPEAARRPRFRPTRRARCGRQGRRARYRQDREGSRKPEVRATIEENFKLAEAMGNERHAELRDRQADRVGAVGLDGLKEKIGLARCGKATC